MTKLEEIERAMFAVVALPAALWKFMSDAILAEKP